MLCWVYFCGIIGFFIINNANKLQKLPTSYYNMLLS